MALRHLSTGGLGKLRVHGDVEHGIASQVIVGLLQSAALNVIIASVELRVGLLQQQGPPVLRGGTGVQHFTLVQWDVVVDFYHHPLFTAKELEGVAAVTADVLRDEAVLDYGGEPHQSRQCREHEAFVVVALSKLLAREACWQERLVQTLWVQFTDTDPMVRDVLVLFHEYGVMEYIAAVGDFLKGLVTHFLARDTISQVRFSVDV
ncbi:hypothetical protein DQ04_00181010 [Trypanosoma grayi]|uniref:hypothetical protein n=1 Tax=Trypanosoma grayi TaxID=71804 RepID=UPI0004F448E7|nr:hypothetical protein DQ04_00181010 [Trypanosoma grayi]KEG15108.1 hypothetical protein DQ04_00181010 [Trypanosoma grayi]